MTTNTITPKVSISFEPGAILKDSWGWEQTNVDFYCIIGRKGDFITFMPMTVKEEYNAGSMTSKVVPDAIDLTAAPIRKKIKSFKKEFWNEETRRTEYRYDTAGNVIKEEAGFSFREGISGGWVKLWSGNVAFASHYA